MKLHETILLKYQALFVILEKAAKYEIVAAAKIGGALRDKNLS